VREEPGEKYRVLAENAVQGIIVLQDGKLRYANARVRGFLKEPIEELTPEVLVNMVHPDDRPMVLSRYRQRLRGEEVPKVYSFRTVAADGRVLWLEFSVSLIEWEGRPATLVLAENITERKKMEAALVESEKTVRALLNSSPDAAILIDTEGTILSSNATANRVYGRDGRPLVGRKITDLEHPEEKQSISAKRAEVFRTGKPVLFEHEYGGMWFERNCYPILDEKGGVTKLACYGRNVTEQKRATEALKENELRYRLLAENVSDFIWSADRNLRPTYVSPGVMRLLGYTPEELMALRLEDQLSPHAVAFVRKVYAQEKAKEKKGFKEQPQSQVLVLEYRRKDGSTFISSIGFRRLVPWPFPPKGNGWLSIFSSVNGILLVWIFVVSSRICSGILEALCFFYGTGGRFIDAKRLNSFLLATLESTWSIFQPTRQNSTLQNTCGTKQTAVSAIAPPRIWPSLRECSAIRYEGYVDPRSSFGLAFMRLIYLGQDKSFHYFCETQ